jgi:hypothetical protein
MRDPKKLDGWGEIALVLTQAAGVPISVDQAARYARRAEHPLPVQRMGRSERKRIVAVTAAVVEWCVQEFG